MTSKPKVRRSIGAGAGFSWASASPSASDDVDDLTPAPGAELHLTLGQSEQRVVAAPTHVVAGMEMRAALADDDLTGLDRLTAERLHAEALGIGVTAVAGRSAAFGL